MAPVYCVLMYVLMTLGPDDTVQFGPASIQNTRVLTLHTRDHIREYARHVHSQEKVIKN